MTVRPILQVEDDENDIIFVRYAFQQAQIINPMQVVKNGQEAIHYLSGIGKFADRTNYPLPCLVLLDLKLPMIGGLEVLQWIRRSKEFSDLVVIVFSSSSAPLDVQQAYRLGINSFIVKPSSTYERAELVHLLKRWWLHFNVYPPECETRENAIGKESVM